MPLETEVILLDKNRRKDGPANSEDLALKSAAAYFGDELIHWLGIRERALRAVPTEMVELETRHMYEDFLYEMENGMYYHFEFESDSISKDDLKRFREYEASTARIYNAPVVTYVICSSGGKKLRDSITEGINTYRVRLIRLKDANADLLFNRLGKKSASVLTREDIIPLLFSPLMGGHSSQKERILQCIEVLRNAETIFPQNDIRKMEAILYIFAVKFLDDTELESIKEAVAMTKLGQMIWDDALEKGREEGERIGREEGERIGQERYSRLIMILNKEKKDDLIIKIAADPEYREALYREYGI